MIDNIKIGDINMAQKKASKKAGVSRDQKFVNKSEPYEVGHGKKSIRKYRKPHNLYKGTKRVDGKARKLLTLRKDEYIGKDKKIHRRKK